MLLETDLRFVSSIHWSGGGTSRYTSLYSCD